MERKKSIRDKLPPDFSQLPHDRNKLGNCFALKPDCQSQCCQGKDSIIFETMKHPHLRDVGMELCCQFNPCRALYQPTHYYPFHRWLEPALLVTPARTWRDYINPWAAARLTTAELPLTQQNTTRLGVQLPSATVKEGSARAKDTALVQWSHMWSLCWESSSRGWIPI